MAGVERDLLGALAERELRIFLAGRAAAALGTAMAPVAVTFAVLDGISGATGLGVVLGADAVPLVALILLGGVLADRISRRLTMTVADAVQAACLAGMAGLVWTHRAGVVSLALLFAGTGAASAFLLPALAGLLPETVPAGRLQQANALRGLVTGASAILGPALAGVLVATGSPAEAIAVAAGCFALAAVASGRLRVGDTPAASEAGVWGHFREGLSQWRRRTWVWVVDLQFTFWHLGVYAPFLVLGAVIAKARLGGAPAWAAIQVAFAIGSLLGALAALRIRPTRPIAVATIAATGFVPMVALLAVGAPLATVCAAAVCAGATLPVFGALWDTTLAEQVPPAVLSRVSSLDYFVSVAAVPVGFALAGPAAGLLGARTVLLAGCGYALASALVVLAVPAVREVRRRAPEAPATGAAG